MPTPPTPITPYGTPPSSSEPADFDARADAKVAQDVVFVGEANDLAENVYDNAVEAVAAATTATAQATLAAASGQVAAANAGATAWVSGATYAVGARVWSLINQQIYRRVSAGAGTTDPRDDGANWARVYAEPELVTAESLFL